MEISDGHVLSYKAFETEKNINFPKKENWSKIRVDLDWV